MKIGITLEILRHNSELVATIINVCHHTPSPYHYKDNQEVPILYTNIH